MIVVEPSGKDDDKKIQVALDALNLSKWKIENCYFHESKLRWWQIFARIGRWRFEREIRKSLKEGTNVSKK